MVLHLNDHDLDAILHRGDELRRPGDLDAQTSRERHDDGLAVPLALGARAGGVPPGGVVASELIAHPCRVERHHRVTPLACWAQLSPVSASVSSICPYIPISTPQKDRLS